MLRLPFPRTDIKIKQKLPGDKKRVTVSDIPHNRWDQYPKAQTYLIIPSSSVSDTGLNKLSIISTLGDCVLTDALYREINGHCLELTTYRANIRQVQSQFQTYLLVSFFPVLFFVHRGRKSSLARYIQLQWMAHQNALVIHGRRPSQELLWELWKPEG